MPAIMMMDAVGDIAKVTGRSNDIVATGPIPGSTPMSVPTKTPMKHATRLEGCKADGEPVGEP